MLTCSSALRIAPILKIKLGNPHAEIKSENSHITHVIIVMIVLEK